MKLRWLCRRRLSGGGCRGWVWISDWRRRIRWRATDHLEGLAGTGQLHYLDTHLEGGVGVGGFGVVTDELGDLVVGHHGCDVGFGDG